MDYEDEDETEQEFKVDLSMNRSGLVHIITKEVGTQTEEDFHTVNKPPIFNQVIDTRVKNACVRASVDCKLSTAMEPVVVKAVCESLYGHYYLSKEEAFSNDPDLTEFRPEQDLSQNNKRQCRNMICEKAKVAT